MLNLLSSDLSSIIDRIVFSLFNNSKRNVSHEITDKLIVILSEFFLVVSEENWPTVLFYYL